VIRAPQAVQEGQLSAEPSPFSTDALDLRRSLVEMRTYAEVLAERLERALPDRVTVERRREGLFRKETQIAKLSFRGDRATYELAFGKGQVTAARVRVVHGIALNSTPMAPAEWLAELGQEVRAIAEQTDAANDALLGLL
jgi:hypothetical protein